MLIDKEATDGHPQDGTEGDIPSHGIIRCKITR